MPVTICDHLEKLKNSPVNPLVFTEHGAIMAASVLSTNRAIEVSVFIVKAFLKLRRLVAEHKELSSRIAQIENHLADHDEQNIELIRAIKQLLKPEPPPRKGFHADKQ